MIPLVCCSIAQPAPRTMWFGCELKECSRSRARASSARLHEFLENYIFLSVLLDILCGDRLLVLEAATVAEAALAIVAESVAWPGTAALGREQVARVTFSVGEATIVSIFALSRVTESEAQLQATGTGLTCGGLERAVSGDISMRETASFAETALAVVSPAVASSTAASSVAGPPGVLDTSVSEAASLAEAAGASFAPVVALAVFVGIGVAIGDNCTLNMSVAAFCAETAASLQSKLVTGIRLFLHF